MSRPGFILDFSALETYECGALLLAILAYPSDKYDAHRASVFVSLCSQHLRDRYENTDEENIPQLIKPIYAFRAESDVKKGLKTFDRRLRDRLVAARMIMGFLQEASGTTVKLPRGVTRLSLNQLSVMVLKDANQTDPENVESRVWRPSIPVIHIAAALAVVMNDAERGGTAWASVRDILGSRTIIEQVANYAQLFEIYIENGTRIKSKLHINQDNLVELLQQLEADHAIIFVPEGADPRYDKAVKKANFELDFGLQSARVFPYDVRQPMATFDSIFSLTASASVTHRVVVAPNGPKIFAALATVIGLFRAPHVTVLRASLASSAPAHHVEADGTIVAIDFVCA